MLCEQPATFRGRRLWGRRYPITKGRDMRVHSVGKRMERCELGGDLQRKRLSTEDRELLKRAKEFQAEEAKLSHHVLALNPGDDRVESHWEPSWRRPGRGLESLAGRSAPYSEDENKRYRRRWR